MSWILATMLLAAGEPPAAMVLEAGPDATVQESKGKARPLRAGDKVADGAVVESGKAELVLFLRGPGATEIVKAKHRVLVEADGCSPSSARTRVARKASAATLKRLQKLIGERGGVGLARRSPPEDVAGSGVLPMHGTNVADPRPTFRWDGVPDAEQYEVRFYSGETAFRKLVWAMTTKEARLAYPKGEAKLKPDAVWNWEVRVKRQGQEGFKELVSSCEFTVMRESEAKGLEEIKAWAAGEKPSDWMLGALAAEALGSHEQALELYKRVDKAHPGVEQVMKALRHFHKLARNTEAERAVKARMKKLGMATD